MSGSEIDCNLIFKKDMFVKIDDECLETDRRFTVAHEMRGMRGTIQKIDYVESHGVRIKGFIWYGGDLVPMESIDQKPLPKLDPIFFDPKELVNV